MAAEVIEFSAIVRRKTMAASDGHIVAQTTSPAPVQHPQQILAQSLSVNQVAPYVPANVWTPEILLDYHKRLYDQSVDNNNMLEHQRQREHKMALIVLAGFAAILAVGFWFSYMKMDVGRDIVISAVSVGLGYAAGYGTGLTKPRP
jgi:hypothetical protein